MIRDILASDHGIEDFMVTVPLELMEQAEKAKMTFVALMGLVAGISLLVGGVGIMNIMLATITERTRKSEFQSSCARRSDIVMQFLLGNHSPSPRLGGILGILIGPVRTRTYGTLIELMETFAPSVYESLPPSMKGMTPEVSFIGPCRLFLA